MRRFTVAKDLKNKEGGSFFIFISINQHQGRPEKTKTWNIRYSLDLSAISFKPLIPKETARISSYEIEMNQLKLLKSSTVPLDSTALLEKVELELSAELTIPKVERPYYMASNSEVSKLAVGYQVYVKNEITPLQHNVKIFDFLWSQQLSIEGTGKDDGKLVWPRGLQFSPDGKSLFVLDETGRVQEFDSSTGEFVRVLCNASEEDKALDFSIDNREVCLCSRNYVYPSFSEECSWLELVRL